MTIAIECTYFLICCKFSVFDQETGVKHDISFCNNSYNSVCTLAQNILSWH